MFSVPPKSKPKKKAPVKAKTSVKKVVTKSSAKTPEIISDDEPASGVDIDSIDLKNSSEAEVSS